jgi:hypothetical protein
MKRLIKRVADAASWPVTAMNPHEDLHFIVESEGSDVTAALKTAQREASPDFHPVCGYQALIRDRRKAAVIAFEPGRFDTPLAQAWDLVQRFDRRFGGRRAGCIDHGDGRTFTFFGWQINMGVW